MQGQRPPWSAAARPHTMQQPSGMERDARPSADAFLPCTSTPQCSGALRSSWTAMSKRLQRQSRCGASVKRVRSGSRHQALPAPKRSFRRVRGWRVAARGLAHACPPCHCSPSRSYALGFRPATVPRVAVSASRGADAGLLKSSSWWRRCWHHARRPTGQAADRSCGPGPSCNTIAGRGHTTNANTYTKKHGPPRPPPSS
jgi:hypothetical protein